MGLNKIVDFSTAKLLKEKGFDLYCVFSYWNSELTSRTPGYALEDGTTSQENYWDFDRYYAPTIAEVVMWLYEKHGVWIYTWNSDINMIFKAWIQNLRNKGIDTIEVPNIKIWNSPTEAYQAAILFCLENII